MLQLDPRSASALAYICLARLGQGELPAAAAAAERLIAAHPEQGEGYLFKAMAFYRAGEYRAAMDSVSEALRRQPDNVDMLLLRAKLSILLQRLTDARLDLAKVLESDPNNVAAKTLYARLSGQAPPAAGPAGADARQYADLLRRRRAAETSEREDAAIRQLFLQGDVEAARRQLQEKIRRSPQAPAAARWSSTLDAMARIETLYREGEALRGDNPPAAISRWEEMRRVEAAAFPGQRSRFHNEAAAAAADFFAGRALADLQGTSRTGRTISPPGPWPGSRDTPRRRASSARSTTPPSNSTRKASGTTSRVIAPARASMGEGGSHRHGRPARGTGAPKKN